MTTNIDYDPFKPLNDALIKDAENGRKAVDRQKGDLAEKNKAAEHVKTLAGNRDNYDSAIFALLGSLVGSEDPDNHGNILGLDEDAKETKGNGLAVISDMTQITTLLENIQNGSTKIDENKQVYKVVSVLNTLIDEFKNNPDLTNKEVVNPSTAAAILSKLEVLKSKIADSFNPDCWGADIGGTIDKPVEPDKSIDDLKKGALLGSFTEMNSLISQTSGSTGSDNPKNASAVRKALFDDMNSLASATESASSALSSEFSYLSGVEKTHQSVLAALIKCLIDLVGAIIHNQTR